MACARLSVESRTRWSSPSMGPGRSHPGVYGYRRRLSRAKVFVTRCSPLAPVLDAFLASRCSSGSCCNFYLLSICSCSVPMGDLLTTSAGMAVQLASGSSRSRHGRLVEGIRVLAFFHVLLTRCGQRRAFQLSPVPVRFERRRHPFSLGAKWDRKGEAGNLGLERKGEAC